MMRASRGGLEVNGGRPRLFKKFLHRIRSMVNAGGLYRPLFKESSLINILRVAELDADRGDARRKCRPRDTLGRVGQMPINYQPTHAGIQSCPA